MATLTSTRNTWADAQHGKTTHKIGDKLLAFADAQKKYRTLWFLISLVVQGVFFLPLPAALTFYFNAPIYLIAVTLGLFFSNVIAGMGGAGIRVMLSLFAASVLVHLGMVLIYVW